MRGQWLGEYHSEVEGGVFVDGHIMVNVDETEGHYEAVASMAPFDQNIPSSIAYLSQLDKSSKQSTTARIYPIDPTTQLRGHWENVKKYYGKDILHSSSADVDIDVDVANDILRLNAITDVGIKLYSNLKKTVENSISKVKGSRMNWKEFKDHISSIPELVFLFRGQKKPWSLCTSFHRHGRFNITRFLNDDVKQLQRRLSAITPHFIDLTIPDQNGAFFSLLQHHGYPTPLLDWSHSPYVAAFFAFRDLPINYQGDDVVRIYKFDHQHWTKKFQQVYNLEHPFPHLSVMEFLAIGNPRLVPQQSVTTVTNLYDIEEYILTQESRIGKKLIEAIDIPAKQRDIAMTDLRIMGITAGSMFPSIDGVCEELRERNFDR